MTKHQTLSHCHKAPVTVSSSDEGTSCYICTKCGEACDQFTPEQTLRERITETVVEIIQLPRGKTVSEDMYVDAILAAVEAEMLEKVEDDEQLITPENYDKFSKNNTAIFYENRAIDVRNKQRAVWRSIIKEVCRHD